MQNGHIVFTSRVAKLLDRYAASVGMTGGMGRFLHRSEKGKTEAFQAEAR